MTMVFKSGLTQRTGINHATLNALFLEKQKILLWTWVSLYVIVAWVVALPAIPQGYCHNPLQAEVGFTGVYPQFAMCAHAHFVPGQMGGPKLVRTS